MAIKRCGRPRWDAILKKWFKCANVGVRDGMCSRCEDETKWKIKTQK